MPKMRCPVKAKIRDAMDNFDYIHWNFLLRKQFSTFIYSIYKYLNHGFKTLYNFVDRFQSEVCTEIALVGLVSDLYLELHKRVGPACSLRTLNVLNALGILRDRIGTRGSTSSNWINLKSDMEKLSFLSLVGVSTLLRYVYIFLCNF